MNIAMISVQWLNIIGDTAPFLERPLTVLNPFQGKIMPSGMIALRVR